MKQPSPESAFRAALAWILAIEGRYSNHPADKGGPTYAGVSHRAVCGLRDENGQLEFDLDGDGDVDADDIRHLEERPDLIDEFYRRYWEAAGCHRLPWPASLFVFDAAVHSGPRIAVVTLQKAVGAKRDGVVGSDTVAATARASAALLAREYLTIRARLFHDIVGSDPSQEQFLNGWLARQFGLLVEALVVRP